jgi:ABC-2 type transport system ATP-binding protein
VLLSSHILSEVEALCDRVTIIRGGRAAESGTFAELARPVPGLADLPGVHSADLQGTRVSFEVDTPRLDAALGLLHQAGIRSLTATPPTLEELFLRHYGDHIGTEEVDAS